MLYIRFPAMLSADRWREISLSLVIGMRRQQCDEVLIGNGLHLGGSRRSPAALGFGEFGSRTLTEGGSSPVFSL